MLKVLGISMISSIILIDYCACKISGEISKEEEKEDIYSRMNKL